MVPSETSSAKATITTLLGPALDFQKEGREGGKGFLKTDYFQLLPQYIKIVVAIIYDHNHHHIIGFLSFNKEKETVALNYVNTMCK